MNKLFLAAAFTVATYSANGQAAIGTATPNASSILELSSTSKGFLPPRMSSADRGNISNPATGLVVYQTDAPAGLYVNTGTPAAPNWVNASAASASGVSVSLLAQSSASQIIAGGSSTAMVDIVFGTYAANPAFNGTTYTVPATGIYEITASITATTGLGAPWPAILVNGAVAAYGIGGANSNLPNGSTGRSVATAVLSLTQGQAVRIAVQNSHPTAVVTTTDNGTTRLSIVKLQ